MRWRPVVALLTAALSGAAAAQGADDAAHHDPATSHLDGAPFGMLLIDRLEYGHSDDGNSTLWDVQGWYGGDYNRIWIESEGHGPADQSPEVAEFHALYDRTFSPFWSWQAGLRYDIRSDGAPDTAYAVASLQGLAPQWFETDLSLFLSEDGDLSLRTEVEYDVRLTQRLILQPHLELDVSASDVPRLGIGSGVTSSELGLRLRYEIKRELAPYVGVRWDRLHGDTRELARRTDQAVSSTAFVIGLRAWF